MWSSDTKTPSSWKPPVLEARSESLSSILDTDSPAAPLSTMNPRTLPPSASHFAQTMKISAMGAFVIQSLSL
jgi:hypothetical protein